MIELKPLADGIYEVLDVCKGCPEMTENLGLIRPAAWTEEPMYWPEGLPLSLDEMSKIIELVNELYTKGE